MVGTGRDPKKGVARDNAAAAAFELFAREAEGLAQDGEE